MGEDKRQKRGCSKSLSDEAIEQIILRLPPPAFARFKCVSVQWRRRLSKPSFIDRYKSRNLSLLGFLYNKSYDRVRFQPTLNNNNNNNNKHEHEHEHEQSTMMDILMATDSADNSYCIVNSSNGLQLLYFSNFKYRNLKRDPFYVVRNFVTGGGVTGIPTFRDVTYPSKSKMIRFLVFGFYFDPYDEKPNFTIVEITSDGQLENCRMRSFKYNSLLPDDWEQKVHRVPTPPLVEGKVEASTDDEYHRLSGPSTYLNGSLHWLLEPYGIVAFRLRENKLFFWRRIPGDKEYCKNNGRFCRCISKIREGGCYSNGECSCRYLGEVRDQIVYIRVTGDFVLSMWILEDYYKHVWSHTRRIVVGNMPLSSPSLFFGRVLAFDRTDARVLYLRVKRTVFSYNIVSREANKIFEISKDYGGEDNCLGFIIPYEFPRIPLSVWHQPLTVQESRGGCSNTGGMTKCKVHSAKRRDSNLNAPGSLQNSRPGISQAGINSFANLLGVDNIRPTALPFYDYCPPVVSDANRWRLRALVDPDKVEPYKNDDGLISLYRHFGVTQVAVKYFPRRQPLDDSTGPLLRSYLDFKVPNTYHHLISSVVLYNDFIRVEACLYGSVYERWWSCLPER